MGQCLQCSSSVPDGQSICSMCMGDINHGEDRYYENWAMEQIEKEQESNDQERFELEMELMEKEQDRNDQETIHTINTNMLGTIKMTEFALRHFDRDFGGTKILDLEPKDFETKLNEYKDIYLSHQPSFGMVSIDIVENILDGYAPFCKLLVVNNFTNAKTGTLPITLENHQYLRSGYSSRREGEIAVLSRWFELPISAPKAKYLIIVLYNKEQIDKEAMSDYNKEIANEEINSIGLEPPTKFDADYGIVAILGQMSSDEEPISPISMMRNYMDISMGGSGMKLPTPPSKLDVSEGSAHVNEYKKSLDIYTEEIREFNEKYERSIKFWEKNAIVN